ncbi:MAG: FkbM family methyltransferase [Pseudomonadota bacterium]
MSRGIRTWLEDRLYRLRFPDVAVLHLRPRTRATEPGADGYSQEGQDRYVLAAFFRDDKAQPGFFLDVGSNDPVLFNNTYLFEQLGWKGLAIEPMATLAQRWKLKRSAPLLNVAAGAAEGEVEFEQVEDAGIRDMFSAVVGASTKNSKFSKRRIKVPVRPLSAILAEAGVTRVNFMSLDVEGFELEVLRGMDFSRCRFDVVLIENNAPKKWFGDARIRRVMQDHGFVHYARFWKADDLFVSPQFLAEKGLRSGGVKKVE